jgi:hypothetical protein
MAFAPVQEDEGVARPGVREAGLAERQPVDRLTGEAVTVAAARAFEVVLAGEKEDGGDAFEFGALGDVRGELLAGDQVEASW